MTVTRLTFDKNETFAAIAFLVCVAILVGVAITDHQHLPEKIASHFNGRGEPNGWISRSSFTWSMLAVGIGIPSLVIGIMYLIRFFPAKYLNVPNPTYWRDPANYRKACDFLFISSLWFGSAFLLWQTLFSHSIVAANQVSPPHLDSAKAVLMTVPLLACTLSWVIVIILRFLRTK